MSGCEAGILVIAYAVVVFEVVDWLFFQRVVAERLDRIERLLTLVAEKHSDNNDSVYASDEKKEKRL